MQNDQSFAVDTMVQELQAELQQKSIEFDLQSRNYKIRAGVAETEAKAHKEDVNDLEKQLREEKEKNKQQSHRMDLQIEALERHLREETERHQYTKTKLDNFNDKVKTELEAQLKNIQESDNILKVEKISLLQELQALKDQVDSDAKSKEKAAQDVRILLENEVKAAEGKMKAKVEKTWVEKLKRSEETAAQDVSCTPK